MGVQSFKTAFTSRHVASTCCNRFQLTPLESLVLEDLIQNAHTLFDTRPSPPPIPSSYVAEATSTNTYGSLFTTPGSSQSTQVKGTGSTIRNRPWLVDGIPTSRSTQPSFPSLTSDSAMEIRLASSPTSFLSLLGSPSPRVLAGGAETTPTQGQILPKVRDVEAENSANGIPAEVVSAVPPARSRPSQSRPLLQPEAVTMSQYPPESVLSNSIDFPLSSATSLQTRTEMLGDAPAKTYSTDQGHYYGVPVTRREPAIPTNRAPSPVPIVPIEPTAPIAPILPSPSIVSIAPTAPTVPVVPILPTAPAYTNA